MTNILTISILPETQQPSLSLVQPERHMSTPAKIKITARTIEPAIADLIGDRKYNAGQNKMNQRSRFPIRELEKRNHQSYKTGDRYYIKKCRHLFCDTNSLRNAIELKTATAACEFVTCFVRLHQFFFPSPCCMILAYSPSYFASRFAE